ncbi:MAG: topoisomerase C-terminal repeat-containing protein [Ruminococcus sp.]|nr:topoisomerase C-terminal repeat-containing protein [Ruminococcus sp.]
MVVLLCQNGRTNIIKGFKSKAGNDFDAYLVVDKAKCEVRFEFPDNKK